MSQGANAGGCVHTFLRGVLDALGWLVHLGRTHHSQGSADGNAKTMQLHNEVFLPEVVTLLKQGHTVTLPLRGFSMRPFLEDGRDKALLVKAEAPQVGDAVLAEISPKTFVLHRIVAIEGDHVTLLGDGNLSTEHCLLHDVHGKATAFYRKGRQTPDRTDGRKWRTYSWWWMHLRPVRRYLLAIHRRVIL